MHTEILARLNGASVLGRDIIDCKNRIKGAYDLLDLVASHKVSAANIVNGSSLEAAEDDHTGILDTLVHERVNLLPESACSDVTGYGSGVTRKELYSDNIRIEFANELTSLTDIASYRPVGIVSLLSNCLLRIPGLEIAYSYPVLVVLHMI